MGIPSWDKIPAAKESSPEVVERVMGTGMSDPRAGVEKRVENPEVEDMAVTGIDGSRRCSSSIYTLHLN
jgi:hypothetical protein